ncbi:MAG: hypothetical protein ACO39R_02905 [Pontimonas sp.]
MNGSAVERADWLARRLHLTNNAVGAVAVVVYLIIVSIALSERAWFAVVALTCVLFGVGLIHLTVKTFLAHMELLRSDQTH